MIWAALVLAFGGVLPLLCATPAKGDGMRAQMEPHAHPPDSGMPLLAEPNAEHGCAEPAPPLLSRESSLGFVAGFASFRNLILEVETPPIALLLVAKLAVTIRAMFQAHRL